MDEYRFETYWNDLPTEKEKAATYDDLKQWWGTGEREVRKLLHDLSSMDNGDDFVLIRSSRGKGFYRTDNKDEIERYKQECLNMGRSVFAPIKKINRILKANLTQMSIENNLRVIREGLNMKQRDVCEIMQEIDEGFDTPMLSKMENGVCLPTPRQLAKLCEIYNCSPDDLVKVDLYGV